MVKIHIRKIQNPIKGIRIPLYGLSRSFVIDEVTSVQTKIHFFCKFRRLNRTSFRFNRVYDLFVIPYISPCRTRSRFVTLVLTQTETENENDSTTKLRV